MFRRHHTIEGYGPVSESPDRTTIVTVGKPNDYLDTLIFYDLINQTGVPSNFVLPREGWEIGHLIWARDGRVVYALAHRIASQPRNEHWRVDPATKRSELVASDLPTGTRPISISNDGRWLLTQNSQSTVLVDLLNGQIKGDLLPQVVVSARSS